VLLSCVYISLDSGTWRTRDSITTEVSSSGFGISDDWISFLREEVELDSRRHSRLDTTSHAIHLQTHPFLITYPRPNLLNTANLAISNPIHTTLTVPIADSQNVSKPILRRRPASISAPELRGTRTARLRLRRRTAADAIRPQHALPTRRPCSPAAAADAATPTEER